MAGEVDAASFALCATRRAAAAALLLLGRVLLLLLLLLPGRELFMRALRRRGRGVRHAGGAARGVRAGGEGGAGRGEQQRVGGECGARRAPVQARRRRG